MGTLLNVAGERSPTTIVKVFHSSDNTATKHYHVNNGDYSDAIVPLIHKDHDTTGRISERD